MKRKTILKAHLMATIIAATTITLFFSFSLIAELNAEVAFIKTVKTGILYALPIMILAMPILKITGDKLAGNSGNPIIRAKKQRMKWMSINGIVLIALAIFLYYRSHYQEIDGIFLAAQLVEFVFGLANLNLIFRNAKSGWKLSRT